MSRRDGTEQLLISGSGSTEDVILEMPSAGSGGGRKEDSVPLLEPDFDRADGLYRLELDYTQVPAFNLLEGSEADHGVGDIGGSLRFFIELSHAGHAFFNEKSWARVLHICRYDAFLSGDAQKEQEAIKTHFLAYRRIESAQRPWGSPAFKALKAHFQHHKRELGDILKGSFEAAQNERFQKNIPLRCIIFWGDILSDRDDSCTDLPLLYAMFLLNQHGIPFRVLASNHGWRHVELFQFMRAHYTEPEIDKKKPFRFLELFQARDTDDVLVLTGEKQDFLKEALKYSINESHAVDPERLIRFLKNKVTTPDQLRALRELFNYLRNIPHNFLRAEPPELKERLRELLSFMPLLIPIVIKLVQKDISILTQEGSPIGVMMMDLLKEKEALPKAFHTLLHINTFGEGELTPEVEEYIAGNICQEGTLPEMKELFSKDLSQSDLTMALTGRLNLAVYEEIRRQLMYLEPQPHYEAILYLLSKDKQGDDCSRERGLMRGGDIDLLGSLTEWIQEEESKKHPAQKKYTPEEVASKAGSIADAMVAYLTDKVVSQEEATPDTRTLLARYKLKELQQFKYKKMRQFRSDRVKKMLAGFDPDVFPVDNEAALDQLIRLSNEESLVDIGGALQAVLVGMASVLRQYLMFPDKLDPSATSLLCHVVPGVTPEELEIERLDGNSAALTLRGRPVAERRQAAGESVSQFKSRIVAAFKALEPVSDLPLNDDNGNLMAAPAASSDFETLFLLEKAELRYGQALLRVVYRTQDEPLPKFQSRIMKQLSLLQQGQAAVEARKGLEVFLPPTKLSSLRYIMSDDMKCATYTLDDHVFQLEFRMPSECEDAFMKRCSRLYKVLKSNGRDPVVKSPINVFWGVLKGDRLAEELSFDSLPQTAQLRVNARSVVLLKKEKGEDKYAFNERWGKVLKAKQAHADTRMLDENGIPTRAVQTRFAELSNWDKAWRHANTLVYRSGLSGPYCTHAPLVGIQGETTDQSMVLHYLVPIAHIFLRALEANRKESNTSTRQEEARKLHPFLQSALNATPKEKGDILHSPVVHYQIWQLMEAINTCYQYFLQHSLIVTDDSQYRIPETHIGLLSRSSDAQHYEQKIIDAGRQREDMDPNHRRQHEPVIDLVMGQGIGACSEKNPLLLFVYPLAAFLWSRANKMEHMNHYSGLPLIPLLYQFYAHMGVSAAPLGNCLDEPSELEQLRRFRGEQGHTESKTAAAAQGVFTVTKCYAVLKPFPKWAREFLQQTVSRLAPQSTPSISGAGSRESTSEVVLHTPSLATRSTRSRSTITPLPRTTSSGPTPPSLRDAWSNPGWFVPLLSRELLDLILLKSERPSQGRRVTIEAALDADPLADGGVPSFPVHLDLKEELDKCIQKLLSRFRGAGDESISVYGVVYEFLATIATDEQVKVKGLAHKIHLLLECMPHPHEMDARARYAFNVRASLLLSRMPHAAKLAEFMLPFYALDERSMNAMLRLEMYAFYDDPEKYSVALGDKAGADHFQDSVLHRAVVEGAREDRKKHLAKSETTMAQRLFGGLAVYPAMASLYGQFIFFISEFNNNDVTESAISVLANTYFFALTPSVALALYLLVEFRHRLPSNMRPCLEVLSRLFPRLSGVSRHALLSLGYRSILAYESFSISFKLASLALGEPICSDSIDNITDNVTDNLTDNVTVTAASSSLNQMDFLWVGRIFMYVGAAVSVYAFVLSLIDPSTEAFPGSQRPRWIFARFEAFASGTQRAQSALESISWFELSLVIAVGIYAVLVVSDATCSSYLAASIGAGSMVIPLALRFIAYPLKCPSTTCLRSQEDANPLDVRRKKRAVRVVFQVLTAFLTVPLDFYLQGVFGASLVYVNVDSNFELYTFLKHALGDTTKTWLLVGSLVSTGILTIDKILSYGRFYIKSDDLDVAREVRLIASSRTEAQKLEPSRAPEDAKMLLDMLRLSYIAVVNNQRLSEEKSRTAGIFSPSVRVLFNPASIKPEV